MEATGTGAKPRITLDGADAPEVGEIVERLAAADVLGQLLRRDGRMAELATEGGDVKLDWVDGVEKGLGAPGQIETAEQEGADIVAQGIRQVIWSGMGGSVQTVYALKRMGYLDQPRMAIHPLDSTDPASLNRILAAIGAPGGRDLGAALRQTMMIGVSMGMTSEEPITHLAWFDALLQEHGVPDPGSHIQVMTLPDSYLDQFARPRGSRMVPIQLDAENHTPGRMSAPATRVFIRPLALLFASLGAQGGVRAVLERGQSLYRLSHAMSGTERIQVTREDAFVRLAAWLSLQAERGHSAPKLLVQLPPGWDGFAPWLEQLVEESLGKGGKGFLIFYGQPADARYGDDCAVLRIHVDHFPEPPVGPRGLPALDLRVPATTGSPLPREARGLGGLTGLFLGFKKTVACYGYLQDIVFAGQPAVEAYKKYARDLREAPGAVALDRGAAGDTGGQHRVSDGVLTLDYSSLVRRGLMPADGDASIAGRVQRMGGDPQRPADVFAALLVAARDAGSLRYLDLTWNGELSGAVRAALDGARDRLAGGALGIPAKVRTGPSDYHSTEQGETDGPPELVSLRLVAERHDAVASGSYDDKFLLAQARGTWQAMEDAGRWIVFMTLPEAGETTAGQDALRRLEAYFGDTAERLRG
jgi:hypothetical protein